MYVIESPVTLILNWSKGTIRSESTPLINTLPEVSIEIKFH